MMEFAAYSRSVSEYSEFTRFGPYLLGLCLSPTPTCKACRSKSDFLDTPLARQVISGLEVVFARLPCCGFCQVKTDWPCQIDAKGGNWAYNPHRLGIQKGNSRSMIKSTVAHSRQSSGRKTPNAKPGNTCLYAKLRLMFARRCLFAIVVLLATALPSAGAEHSNVILITLDTTRADRMGFLGSKRKLTPNLDALARDGIVFTRAYAQAPLTTPSHATILTGTYPQFHNVNMPYRPMPKSLPFAPAILRGAGYRTAAFVGSIILQARNGQAPGFDRGFDEYNADFHFMHMGEDSYSSNRRRAAEVVARAEKWVEKNDNEPFFLWIHLYDPHAPYDPPQPFAERFRLNPYDGEIAYVDSVLGGFFDRLRAAKLFDDTLIAVMADHGEGLGEHGELYHGLSCTTQRSGAIAIQIASPTIGGRNCRCAGPIG